jgi:aspartyl-tRNA(Asn)/glutamyl-tRNA(Gln) amidotransferase subunit A
LALWLGGAYLSLTGEMSANMQPWPGDQCSLVDAFRSGERSPLEEVDAVFAAIEESGLNAFSFLDHEGARAAAATADVSLPFGGVPLGVKELAHVKGWPATEASVPLKDIRATQTSTMVERLIHAGAVPVGLTTASEFGGVNVTRTVLNGVTRNPWNVDQTPGGSSGGSAAAVAGGILTAATAGDGGGSIRIPAGFCGLVGLKVTYGRIPNGPSADIGNLTAVPGCVSRSVRDSARWLDVTNGPDLRTPLALPRVEGYEAGLGSYGESLRGLRVAVLPTFGGAYVNPVAWDVISALGSELISALGLRQVDVDVNLPSMGTAWSLSGLISIRGALGDLWPDCEDQLTPEMAFGLRWAEGKWDAAAAHKCEARRVALNEAMADMFSACDLVMTATNPDGAFTAAGPLPTVFGGREVGGWNNGRLTAPSNLYGNPAIAIPAGDVDGLPVSLQVLAPHHHEALLLDIALTAERLRPWPLVAPAR